MICYCCTIEQHSRSSGNLWNNLGSMWHCAPLLTVVHSGLSHNSPEPLLGALSSHKGHLWNAARCFEKRQNPHFFWPLETLLIAINETFQSNPTLDNLTCDILVADKTPFGFPSGRGFSLRSPKKYDVDLLCRSSLPNVWILRRNKSN